MKNDFKVGLAAFTVLILGGVLISNPIVSSDRPVITPKYLKRVHDGALVNVVFDLCKFDDEGWDEVGDPMGGIACNETYTMQYDKNSKTWTSSGYNEMASIATGERRTKQHTGAAPGPKTGNVYIWGVRFSISEDGLVTWYGKNGKTPEVVGHYELIES